MKKPTLRELLGVALRNARQSKKLSQSKVADLVNEKYGSNWKKANVSDIETGKSFSLETYEEVLMVLDFELVDEPLKPILLTLTINGMEKDFGDWCLENGYNFRPHEGGIDADASEENKELFDKAYSEYCDYLEQFSVL